MSFVQLLEPKGLYVAGWVYRVNKQNKQVQFCDDQEFMTREHEIKIGRVVNQVFSNVCSYGFGNVCCIRLFFWSTLHCLAHVFRFSNPRLLSSGVTRRLQ